MLSCQNLGLKISDQVIFQNLNFTALQSAILYIKGDNGAGKTSLLRMIAGIKNSSVGEIIYNHQLINLYDKPYCNYIGHQLALKPDLYVRDYMDIWAKIYNGEELLIAAITYFDLHNLIGVKCSNLSAGQQKKIALTRLILCQAKLWILDEIETNLDNHTMHLLHQLIVSKADCGGIILISSHLDPRIASAQAINLNDYHE